MQARDAPDVTPLLLALCCVEMKLPKVIKAIRGFSTPFGGLSWASTSPKVEAAREFREGVIDDLDGFFPSPGNWPMGFENNMRNAIERIEPRVQKFKYYLSSKRRREFISAWSSFKTQALGMTWGDSAAYRMYPSMRPEGSDDPEVIFYSGLESLLKYSEET